MMELSQYKIKEKRNPACFTCVHVMTKSKPILLVSNDDDSSCEFTCGTNGHPDGEVKIISLEEAADIDNLINELAVIPEGVCAERKKFRDKWTITSLQS